MQKISKHKWSIKFDEPLKDLLKVHGDVDPDAQFEICSAFAALGLANHKMYSGQDGEIHWREHRYRSTKAMRKLAKKYLYSTKHWPIYKLT